jgi:hypothetical protein
MNRPEKYAQLAFDTEVQFLPPEAMELFMQMIGYYTGFAKYSRFPEEERILKAEQLQRQLLEEYNIGLDDRVYTSVLRQLNPESE